MANAELILNSGHKIRVARLDQHLVYAGVLEGVPNSRINRAIVEDVVARYSEMAPEATCHLFEPAEQPYPERPHVMLLPSTACAALLERQGRSLDDWPCWERLVLIWFQEDYAMPISPDILSRIRALDWPALAIQIEM